MKQKDRPHGEFVSGSNECLAVMGAINVPADNMYKKISHILKLHALNNFKVLLIKFIDTSLKEDRSV